MITHPRPTGTHLPSLFLALISGFGVVVGLPAAVVLTLVAVQLPAPGAEMVTLAWVSALVALLNLPALIYSVPRALGHPAPRWQVVRGWRLASIAMGFWVLDLVAASLLAGRPTPLSIVLLPPLSMLAVGIPLWWLVELGRRGLRTSPQRTWGAASVSLMATIPAVIFIELLVFLFLGILILVWLVGGSPDLLEQLQRTLQSMTSGNISTDRLLTILQPYLDRPGVILAGVMILAVLTPLLEEFFKPLALWFVPGRRLSEAEGFTLGMVTGAIFALLETLGTLPALSGRGSGQWLALVLTRTGTGLLHITCSGLVGWGLAAAWGRAGYLRLAGLYLLAVGFHGGWNLFAQLMSLGQLLPEQSLGATLGHAAPFIMGALTVLMALTLVRANRYLWMHQEPLLPPPALMMPPMFPAAPLALNPTAEPAGFLLPEVLAERLPADSAPLSPPEPTDPGPDLKP